jgi:hypothetical protein
MTNRTTFTWILASLFLQRLAIVTIYLCHGGCRAYGIEETLMAAAWLVVAIRTEDRLLRNLWGFGLTCGIVELLSDFASVSTGTLHYNTHEAFIWKSPWYMPFTWLDCMFLITYAGLFLAEKYGNRVAILATGFGYVFFMLFVEWIARYCGFWFYHSPKMIVGVPLYIIVCEVATCLAIVPVYQLFQTKRFGFLLSGLLLGVVILSAGELGFFLETGTIFIPWVSPPIHAESAKLLAWS